MQYNHLRNGIQFDVGFSVNVVSFTCGMVPLSPAHVISAYKFITYTLSPFPIRTDWKVFTWERKKKKIIYCMTLWEPCFLAVGFHLWPDNPNVAYVTKIKRAYIHSTDAQFPADFRDVIIISFNFNYFSIYDKSKFGNP